NQFGARPFASDGFGAAFVLGENPRELRFVAVFVGFIGLRHQALALRAVIAIGSEVRVNAPRDVTIQAFQFRRRLEGLGFLVGLFAGRRFCVAGASARVASGLL